MKCQQPFYKIAVRIFYVKTPEPATLQKNYFVFGVFSRIFRKAFRTALS